MANEDKYLEFRCLEVSQPIGTFYVGAISAADLVAISYADVRRPEGRDLEVYIGTQRDLSEGRVAELKQYVTTVDACFPTGIILAISSEDATYSKKAGTLRVRKNERVAKIIDGQHRIAGLEEYDEDADFELNVTIFIDMDIEDQAMVFATINLKQTKVTKSLAYDLYEYSKSRSPQKTCHNIAKLMNFREGSPFSRRIKILGKASEGGGETITQATFVDRVMRLITNDAMADRDKLKRGKPLERIHGKSSGRFIFRDRFIDERDAEIAKIIWNYFTAVRDRWPEGWDNLSPGYILARTTGFAALVRVLPVYWHALGEPESIPKAAKFAELLNDVDLQSKDFTTENFVPGSTGESALVEQLKTAVAEA